MMLLSDIHSEEPGKENFYSKYLTPIESSQLLILAGDVGTFKFRDKMKEFFLRAIQIYSNVLWVPGNHDYDGILNDSDFNVLASEVNQIGPGKVAVLNRSSIILEVSGKPITFIGCTLWTNAGWNRSRDRDFHLNSNERQLLHLEDEKWLTNEIKLNPGAIVITHHPPITLSTSSLKEYYSNNFDHLVKNVKLWCFGHLHQRYDIKINNSLLVSNPIGRFKDKIKFNPNFISLKDF